jgi:hypothetical protein
MTGRQLAACVLATLAVFALLAGVAAPEVFAEMWDWIRHAAADLARSATETTQREQWRV